MIIMVLMLMNVCLTFRYVLSVVGVGIFRHLMI